MYSGMRYIFTIIIVAFFCLNLLLTSHNQVENIIGVFFPLCWEKWHDIPSRSPVKI